MSLTSYASAFSMLTLKEENAEEESKLEFDQQCISCTRSGLFKLA